jgi:tetratricopeptide (TPR) repeat protein
LKKKIKGGWLCVKKLGIVAVMVISLISVVRKSTWVDAETLQAKGQRPYQEGNDLHQRREYKKALNSLERALIIIKKVYGNEHPSTAAVPTNIGVIRHGLDKYRKAIGCHEQALAIGKKIYGEEHPSHLK